MAVRHLFCYVDRAVRGTGDQVSEGDELVCSAKGCQHPAVWQLLWNNPRIHTPERRKIWLACDEHRPSLSEFLGARNFLRDTQPVPD